MIRKFIQRLCLLTLLILSSAQASEYIGGQACQKCHQDEYQQWQGSHHDMAMRHADAESVLGDFEQVDRSEQKQRVHFYRKDQQYWVRLTGPDGELQDHQVLYTFGWYPLQQYMVEFDDGRVQLIPWAWDSRPEEEGGQRWFHLYPEFTDSRHEFYWTNPGQNWNFMCADCHSTNLEKNYTSESNTYATTWSEINVSCEACHGPGSAHLEWTENKDEKQANAGFSVDLSRQVKRWQHAPGKATLEPAEVTDTQQNQICAQCHSRRAQLNESSPFDNEDFLDRHRLSLITEELYELDGQIFDEVYVYGSFLQSKMHQAGVVCSDCHNPHTAELKLPESTVCLQCHQPESFASKKHTLHEQGTDAAQCTTCHMPETLYMQVDWRRDHSWKVPRPDLTVAVGTPNVCSDCHEDQDAQWAATELAKVFGDHDLQQERPAAMAFAASAYQHPATEMMLSYTAQNQEISPILRASALSRLNGMQGNNAMVALARGSRHSDPLVRLGAVQGSEGLNIRERWDLLKPLLDDPVLSVRSSAASVLAGDWASLTKEQRAHLQPVLDEYMATQEYGSDRGAGLSNLANIYAAQGDIKKAEQYYQKAIDVEPGFAGSYINYADLLRQQGRDPQGISVLVEGENAQPFTGQVSYALGLAYTRSGERAKAKSAFERATQRSPDNSQYLLLYGLSLEPFDPNKAVETLYKAYQISSRPDLLAATCDVAKRNQHPSTQRCYQQLQQITGERR